MSSRTCNSGSWKQWVLETASLSVPLKDRTSIVPRVYGLLPPETLEMSFANFTVSPKGGAQACSCLALVVCSKHVSSKIESMSGFSKPILNPYARLR